MYRNKTSKILHLKRCAKEFNYNLSTISSYLSFHYCCMHLYTLVNVVTAAMMQVIFHIPIILHNVTLQGQFLSKWGPLWKICGGPSCLNTVAQFPNCLPTEHA